MFAGKRITLMGLGLLGRGLGDAQFFAEEGAELIVTDLKTKEALHTSMVQLERFPSITFSLGGHRLEDFRKRDFVVKAAGVPLDSPYIAEARKNGIPIEMSTALFSALTSARLVGITGTRGKSTTTSLIHHVLLKKGIPAVLGGNIRGMSTLPLVRELKAEDTAILELDSWQLQGFGEKTLSPHISVFTNFLPDHLNYYKGDKEAYFRDKANIFRFQSEEDTLVLGEELYVERRDDFSSFRGRICIAREKDVSEKLPASLPGSHNKKNLACAIHALSALGISREDALSAIDDFTGLEGRLEYCGIHNGARIFNDTNATTPDATLAGLRALSEGKNVVLIMGGADKTLDMTELIQNIDTRVKKLIFLPGTGTDRLSEFGLSSLSTPYLHTTSLSEAVDTAFAELLHGDVLLFSPAFASFGLFQNEYDRGDQFKLLIANKSVIM